MSDETAVKTKRPRSDEPVEFEVVERAAMPKRTSGPRTSKWEKVIEAAVANEGKYVLVRKIGTRAERSVMAALTGYAKRHTELVQGKKLHTASNPKMLEDGTPEGGVLVWVTDQPEKQSELPLEKQTAAA